VQETGRCSRGTEYALTSPQVLGLAAVALLALGAVLVVERHVVEPTAAARATGKPVVAVTSAVGLPVGMLLRGSLAFRRSPRTAVAGEMVLLGVAA
jgi:hypothetical protein